MAPTFVTPNSPNGQGTGNFDWRHTAAVLWERRWLGLTVFVVIMTLTLIWLFRQVPTYRATAQLLVEVETIKLLNIQNMVNNETADPDYMNTQVKLIQSRPLAERVIKTLNLGHNKDFYPLGASSEELMEAFQACLDVAPIRETRLITVSVNHPNPQITEKIANCLAESFIIDIAEHKQSTSVELLNWLRKQEAEIKPRVEKSEVALQEYRERARVISLEERENIVVDKLRELNTALTKVHTEYLAVETEWLEVKMQLDQGRQPIEIPLIAAYPVVAQLQQQLNEREIAIAALRERYKEAHPTMMDALSQRKEVESRLQAAAQAAVRALQANHVTMKAKEDSLTVALREQEQQALDLQRKFSEYATLKRNAESERQLYDVILTRMKEASVTVKMEPSNIRLVERAWTPSVPWKPRKARAIAIGLVLGLLWASIACILLHTYDDRIRTYEDVESLGVPLLCSVPRIQGQQHDATCITQRDPESIAADAFRHVHASITISVVTRNLRSLLITSTAPGEGNSMVATNLAIVFANHNERTLLIDGELRRATQANNLGIKPKYGLSHYLTAALNEDDIIYHSNIPNLDMIPAGNSQGDPTELLGSSRFRDLMQKLAARYDRIIIDSPPITAVSDPLILLPHVQGVIFVVQFSKIRREIITRALQKLRSCGAPLIGAILNGIDLKKHSYYYPYGHSYYTKQDESESSKTS